MSTRFEITLTAVVAGLVLSLAAVSQETAQPLRADKILIEKSERRMTLLWRGTPVRMYSIALGGAPVGKKQCQGDQKTPEGIYSITGRNPWSSYHRSLRVSYPNAEDVANARRLRCDPGGDIMIHGLPNGGRFSEEAHASRDWTLGCIAVTNAEIEEVWKAVPNGTAVEIRP
jgi:murein L,D-transpeptidase YafK